MEESVTSGVIEGPDLRLGSSRAFQENDLVFHQGKGCIYEKSVLYLENAREFK